MIARTAVGATKNVLTLYSAIMRQNAPASGVPHALLLVCLALTLFAGPVGLLLFLVIKAVRRK